jgi:hypothetical protein
MKKVKQPQQKMEDNLNKNGRRPQKNQKWKTTLKKNMKNNLKKRKKDQPTKKWKTT